MINIGFHTNKSLNAFDSIHQIPQNRISHMHIRNDYPPISNDFPKTECKKCVNH